MMFCVDETRLSRMEVMKTEKKDRKGIGGRPPKGLKRAMFKISEATDKQIDALADLPDYEDRSHVVRDAVNKLHYNRLEQ